MDMQNFSEKMNKYALTAHEKIDCCFDAIKNNEKDV